MAKVDKSRKQERYRPGVRPNFAVDDEDDEGMDMGAAKRSDTGDSVVQDSRLARLGMTTVSAPEAEVGNDHDAGAGQTARRRQRHVATVVEESDEER